MSKVNLSRDDIAYMMMEKDPLECIAQVVAFYKNLVKDGLENAEEMVYDLEDGHLLDIEGNELDPTKAQAWHDNAKKVLQVAESLERGMVKDDQLYRSLTGGMDYRNL